MNIEEWPEEPNQSVLEEDGDNMTFYLALKNIILRFIPSSLALFIEYGILLSNIIFIATLGDSVLLSGAGLGVFTINIVIFWIDVGLWGGLDTLVSHSYGRKEYYLWGVYLNSSRIVIALLFIPQAILILNVRTFFVYINQPELSAEYAAEYALLLLPGIFFGMQFEWTRRFLLAQGVYMPILYILMTTLVLHNINLLIFVTILDLKVKGVAIATAITYLTNFIAITLFIQFKVELIHRESWHFFNYDWIRRIDEFLKYGVPASLMLIMEWWSYEFLHIYAGWLGLHELATWIIYFSILNVWFIFAFGTSYATSGLIGNSLGAGHAHKSKIYGFSTLLWIFVLSLSIVGLFLLFRYQLVRLYSNDPEVINIFISASFVFSVELFTDLFQGSMAGMLRGLGFQKNATIANFISYWIIMLPLSYIFAFHWNMGLMGVWLGVPIGSSILLLSYLVMIFRASWRKASRNASKKTLIE